MYFSDIEDEIPEGNPSIQIGPLSIWISGFTVNDQAYAYSVLNAPFLLKIRQVVVFSPESEIFAYELKNLKEGFVDMHKNAGTGRSFEVTFMASEFDIKFTSNQLGHIKTEIKYSSRDEGYLRSEYNMDQSYLPEIIKAVNSVQHKYEIDDSKIVQQGATEVKSETKGTINILKKFWPLWLLIGITLIKIVAYQVRW